MKSTIIFVPGSMSFSKKILSGASSRWPLVKSYYIIKYNIFILFVGFVFYFDRFLLFNTLEFISYEDYFSKFI